jgi:preprotein translocase subunit YajC
VVTGGGIIGQIVKVGDDELTVEIGEGMRVKVLRSTVSSVLSKPEPARSSGGGGRGGRQQKEREPAEDEEETAAAEEGEAKPDRKGGRFLSRK